MRENKNRRQRAHWRGRGGAGAGEKKERGEAAWKGGCARVGVICRKKKETRPADRSPRFTSEREGGREPKEGRGRKSRRYDEGDRKVYCRRRAGGEETREKERGSAIGEKNLQGTSGDTAFEETQITLIIIFLLSLIS